MSVHVTSLVWKLDCPATVKIVLLKLADHAKDDGSDVHPSQATVAKECGLTDRSVRSAVKAAIQTGWLVEEPSPGNRANRYRFDKDAMREGGKKFHQEPRSTRNHVPASRNHVPPRRNHVPPINKNRPLTVPEPSPPTPLPGELVCLPGFVETWADWERHRSEKRQRLTPTARSRQLAMLVRQPDPVACLNQSIQNGWTGLFEVKAEPGRADHDPYAGVPRAGAS